MSPYIVVFSAQEWREKYESSESMLKQLELERQQLRENMDKTKVNTEKLINQLRDYKRRVTNRTWLNCNL